MKTKTWSFVAIGVLIISALAAPADSGEEKGSGTVTYGPASVDNQTLSDGSTMQRSHIKAIVLANGADGRADITWDGSWTMK